MSEPSDIAGSTRLASTGLPTPDAMMAVLFEQQKLLSEKDDQREGRIWVGTCIASMW